MSATLVHRGPDEGSTFVDGDLAFGHRRLVVVDREGGHQPMANEDGTVRVIFNGEIYNHVELRRELEDKGHRFRTRSDTEVIVHAWEEWGDACPVRFNGMFAFAIWDARRQRLFLARDRLGIKPLYLHRGREGVTFGSELKAVVIAPWIDLEWDLEAVDDFLTYEYVPGPRSIVRDVTKIPPGTGVTIGRSGAASEPRRYWSLDAGTPVSDTRSAEEQIRDGMRRSVSRRLMADVPLGAFLSGGIDSSIVVGLMSAEADGRVQTFSLGFQDGSYDELRYARLVADRFGTRHAERRVEPEIVSLASKLADATDEPFGDVSTFPTWMVSSLAREEVTVALSGDGGDELFAGYDAYRAHRWGDRLRFLGARSGWGVVDRLLDRVPPRPKKKGPVNLAKRFVEGLTRPEDLEHARWWVFAGPAERRALYSSDLAGALGDRDPFDHYRSLLRAGAEAGFSGLQRQLYADLRGYLADDILVKLDRMSMAVSLEARVPFLDHEFVELAMRIPAEWKLSGGQGKRILRSSFRDLLPRTVLRRGKEGFSIPMKNWLKGPLRPLMEDALSEDRLHARGWFRPAEVRRIVSEHVSGRANHAHRLWCLMAIEFSLSSLESRVRERASVSP